MFPLAFVAGSLQGTDEALLPKLRSMTHLLSSECFHCSQRNSFFFLFLTVYIKLCRMKVRIKFVKLPKEMGLRCVPDPKFSDRYASANNADPDQTAPR